MTKNIIPLNPRPSVARVEIQGSRVDLEIEIETEPGVRWSNVLWVHENGRVLTQTLIPAKVPLDQPPHGAEASDAVDGARAALREAIDMAGEGSTRVSIVVDHPSLVAFVHQVRADLPCTVGPTPEADRASRALIEWMQASRGSGSVPSPEPLAPPRGADVEDETCSNFGAAMTALYAMDPWRTVHASFRLFSVRCPQLGYPQAVAQLVKGPEGTGALLVFESFLEWRIVQFLSQPGGPVSLEDHPSQLVVNAFDPDELEPELAAELEELQWKAGDQGVVFPLANVNGTGPASCTNAQLQLLSIASSCFTQLARQHLRSSAFDGVNTHVASFDFELQDRSIALELFAPAQELLGARDHDDFGSGVSIEELAREYLHERARTVSLATVGRDRSVLTQLLDLIDRAEAGRLPEGIGPASAISSCEALHVGILDYTRFVLFSPAFRIHSEATNARRALKGFMNWLVQEEALHAAAAPLLLAPLEAACESAMTFTAVARSLFEAVRVTRPAEAIEDSLEVGRVDLPWGSGRELTVQRVNRDRVWLRDAADRVGSPVRVPGYDLFQLGVRPEQVLVARTGRAVGGKGGGERRLLEVLQVLPSEMAVWG